MISFWFILVLFATISIGLISFINKVFAKKDFNPLLIGILVNFFMFLFSLIYLYFNNFSYKITIMEVIFSILFGVQIYTYNLIMINALKVIPTSTYVINVRLISSFALLVIGILFFNDSISTIELVGFIMGIIAIILLFEKEKQTSYFNYKKGIFLIFLGTISLIFAHVLSKIFSESSSLPLLISITLCSAFIVSLLFGIKQLKNNISKELTIISFIQSLLGFLYFIALFKIYEIGNLGISYKIMSYSPFIPIILSAIIYREKISNKKYIAIALTIISLSFFY